MKQETNKSNKGVKTMKKTTKKATKKETFTQEAAEKLYENILEMEDTMQKLGADMDKVRSGRLFYMTNHFDITEAEAKAFLDKMEKKENKAEEKAEEELNKMWKEIMKLTIGGEKSTRYMMEFLSDDECKAVSKEYQQWCENYSKTSTGGWSACMSYEYSKDAQKDIIKKHVDKSVVALSVDGRKQLMKKVMDMAEKLLARFGLEMPEIKWQSYNVSTVKKDKLTLNALDFLYRGANDTEDKVIERCMNLFFAYVYFYGEGVKEYFDAHGLTYTKRTGKGYDAWKKMVLDEMKKKETKEEEKKEEGEKTMKKTTLTNDTDKIEISSCANCYYKDANDKLSTINGKTTVGTLKGLKWKQDEDGTITAKDGIMTLHFYRTDNKIPALHVNENGNGTICDVFLTDRNGKEHCMEVRGYIYDDHASDNDQADEWDYGYDFWGRRKFLRFVEEVTGYKL